MHSTYTGDVFYTYFIKTNNKIQYKIHRVGGWVEFGLENYQKSRNHRVLLSSRPARNVMLLENREECYAAADINFTQI